MRYPGYRWVVLGMAWVTLVCLHWSWYLIPSLEYCLSPELSLTHAQFTLILTGPPLVTNFTAIPGGALGDRYGIRLTVAIAAFLAGAFGLGRAFTSSFEGMFALMCLFGIALSIIIPSLPKLVGIWFPPRQAGFASGIYVTAMGIGMSLGLFTGPLFGGWRPAFTYIGILTMATAILWALSARNAPKSIEMHTPPLVSGIKRGLRSKNIWLAGIGISLVFGAIVAFSGNFPHALESVHHMSPQAAGFISSLFTLGLVLGNFFIPMLSDKVGLRKPFLYLCTVTSAICLFSAWHLAPGIAAKVLVSLGGFILGGVPPIIFTLPVEFPEIGPEHVGGASGIVISLSSMGGFLMPLAVLSPLVAAGTLRAYTTGFSVIMILLAASALVTIFLIETGARTRA